MTSSHDPENPSGSVICIPEVFLPLNILTPGYTSTQGGKFILNNDLGLDGESNSCSLTKTVEERLCMPGKYLRFESACAVHHY